MGNSQGQFIIEDCDFSGAGDDCINLHDNSSMGVRRLDDHTLLALRVTQSALQLESGSIIELRRPDLSPTGYTSQVCSAVYQPQERTCILTLAQPLPEHLDEESILFNRSFHTGSLHHPQLPIHQQPGKGCAAAGQLRSGGKQCVREHPRRGHPDRDRLREPLERGAGCA